MIDLYKLLPEEWFEQIGDFSDDEEKYAPVDYDLIETALYEPNSFFGGEVVDLMVDEAIKTFYIRTSIRQPIGDYGWSTIWAWYKSVNGVYDEIKQVIEAARREGIQI